MMTIIDADTHQVRRTIDFPASVAAVTDFILSADERYAYLACFDPNWIMVCDLLEEHPEKAVVKVIKTGLDRFSLTIRADKRIMYGTNFTSDDVFLIDTETKSLLERIPLQVASLQFLGKATAAVNAASMEAGAVAPGEIVTIFGSATGPSIPTSAGFDQAGLLPTRLADSRVLFDGLAAPLLYVSASQWNVIVPYGLNGRKSTKAQLEYLGERSAGFDLPVVQAAPGIFTFGSTDRGQGAILNQDGTVNSPDIPAAKGSIISFFATGEGATSSPGIDGKLAVEPLSKPLLPVIVSINNAGAEIRYVGAAPALAAGVLQVNGRIPLDTPSGGAIPVSIKIGDAYSQTGVTIAVK